MRTIDSLENEVIRLRNEIISLENKNNLLALKHSQLEKIKNFEHEMKQINEELDILRSQAKLHQKELSEQERYIAHLEDLLEFFIYHSNNVHWSPDR